MELIIQSVAHLPECFVIFHEPSQSSAHCIDFRRSNFKPETSGLGNAITSKI